MSFLDTLIFGYRQVVDGANVLVLQRSKVKFVGAGSIADDAVNAQTVITLTGNSSLGQDGSGFSQITGEVNNTSNAKVVAHEYNISAQIPTATPTVIKTIATSTGKTYSVRGIVAVANSSADAYGEWEINCFAINVGGTVSIIGTPVTQKANLASFVLTFTVSGTNLIVTATDPGVSRRWTGAIYVAERSF